MAAVTNATVKNSITELIDSEVIQTLIAKNHEKPFLYRILGDVRPGSGASVTWPRANKMTLNQSESSPHTETDEVPISENTYDETVISPATVALRSMLSKDAKQDAKVDELGRHVVEHSIRLNDQADTDWLSSITSGTNTADNTGSPLTITMVGSAIATYRALKPTGGSGVIVLSFAQIEDLSASVRGSASAVFGSAFGAAAAGTVLNGTSVGYLGQYEGFGLYQTDVPAADGSNDAGAIFSSGMGGALGMNVWRGVEHAGRYIDERLADQVTTDCRYGCALVEDSNLVQIISLNS